jgi:hypothetical protein
MTRPATAVTDPNTIIQIERSVGEPVKTSDTSDAKDSDSLKPKKSRMTPPTNSAIPKALRFIVVSPV